MNLTPSVGRRVWYWPLSHERYHGGDQPFDAGVAHVHTPTTLTLSVTNDMGNPMNGKGHVPQCEPEQATPGHWSWMPYQVNVAKQQSDVGQTSISLTPPDVGGA